MIVQQDDVPAYRFIQDASSKNAGIRREGIECPNGPRNILQSRIPKIGPQKRVAHAHRRAKKARRKATTAANTLGAAFDLSPQTTGREKTKKRIVRPGVIGDEVSFCPSAAHYFRILVRPLSYHKERYFHAFSRSRSSSLG